MIAWSFLMMILLIGVVVVRRDTSELWVSLQTIKIIEYRHRKCSLQTIVVSY